MSKNDVYNNFSDIKGWKITENNKNSFIIERSYSLWSSIKYNGQMKERVSIFFENDNVIFVHVDLFTDNLEKAKRLYNLGLIGFSNSLGPKDQSFDLPYVNHYYGVNWLNNNHSTVLAFLTLPEINQYNKFVHKIHIALRRRIDFDYTMTEYYLNLLNE